MGMDITRGRGASRWRILEHLKRRGATTIPRMAQGLGLNVETVRAHLRGLEDEALVQRSGRRTRGPGRPEIEYRLAPAADELFPNREGALLRDLADYLEETGDADVIQRFFADRLERRRDAALARVEGLEGSARLEEVARILSDEGYMAEVDSDAHGRPRLRLCHCPIRQLVSVTKVPCRVELGFVRELVGARPARVSYIPSGDAACCYSVGG